MRISDWEFRRVLFRSLVKTAAETRYGTPLPPRVRKLMGNELRLIRRRNYVCYFLTVYDLVRFARAQKPPILCQGRGSAANSDRKSTRLNSSHSCAYRMPSSA